MITNMHTRIRPTDRELRWFAHIDRHGPQSSEFLFELSSDTHRCKDTTLRRLQKLREGGYLFRPQPQKQIARAEFHPDVYDLTRPGFEYLKYEKLTEQKARPTGHWWHGFWVSAVTSAIEIAASRAGLEYIPATRILSINDTSLAIPLHRSKLIPDQIFAVKYRNGYRAFALELDRGTEPVRSGAARKSLQKSVRQYREAFDTKAHRRHYGLKSNLIVLWVFMSKARKHQFSKLLGSQSHSFLFQDVNAGFPSFASVQKVSKSIIKLV